MYPRHFGFIEVLRISLIISMPNRLRRTQAARYSNILPYVPQMIAIWFSLPKFRAAKLPAIVQSIGFPILSWSDQKDMYLSYSSRMNFVGKALAANCWRQSKRKHKLADVPA